MTCKGTIRNGAIVLDEAIDLPEGSEVVCEISASDLPPRTESSNGGIYDDLLAFAGLANDLPSDSSENLDKYLYGRKIL